MTSKPTGNTPDQGADRSTDRKPREVRGDLIERAKRAVVALRTPDHSLANVANTIRQSIADVIEAQQRWIDRYGLALMMIREGCVDPEKFADETLSADVMAISALNTIGVTPEMEAAGREWARAHDPSTFADIFAAMWRARPDPHGREATALAAQDARIKELEEALKPFADLAGPLKGEDGRPSEIDLLDKGGTGELFISSHFASERHEVAVYADDFHHARAALKTEAR